MLQEFAGEGIPILASAVSAETFYPYLNDLLPFVINKAVSFYFMQNTILSRSVFSKKHNLNLFFFWQKSSCTVADRSFAVGTIGELLHALVVVDGGRSVAGKLSKRFLPVLVGGVKDSDAEVRNNSVFGLGTLAQAAGPIIASYPLDVCACNYHFYFSIYEFNIKCCLFELALTCF